MSSGDSVSSTSIYLSSCRYGRSQYKLVAAAKLDKAKSGAEHYLEALRTQIQLTEDQLLEGIGVQPLAAVLVEQKSLFEDLGGVFYRIHDHVTKRRGDVEHTLQQLLTLHSRKKPNT